MAVVVEQLQAAKLGPKRILDELGERQPFRAPRQVHRRVTSFVEQIFRQVQRGANLGRTLAVHAMFSWAALAGALMPLNVIGPRAGVASNVRRFPANLRRSAQRATGSCGQ